MKKKERAKIDYIILIAVVILVLFGCVMVYSASYYSAFLKQNGDGAYYLKRQVIGVSLGMISMFVLSRVPFTLWKKLHKPIMIGSVLLLVAVFIPGIGISVHDSNRWINLGLFQLQPSEITKLAMIIVFAAHFEKNRHNMDSFKQAVLPVLAVCAIVAGLIILQPNLSTVVCMAAVTFVIMIGAGVKTRHLVWMGLAAVVLVVLAILVAPYRMKRLLVFLDPWKSTSGDS
ncbi:MAG: FtsW/RodA/SpoVE family cell cycle protein [Clostridia bacterium]|nr:FtsW/RodA/SpoVE family cell cycle protein [Clostridia bacterium]